MSIYICPYKLGKQPAEKKNKHLSPANLFPCFFQCMAFALLLIRPGIGTKAWQLQTTSTTRPNLSPIPLGSAWSRAKELGQIPTLDL